MKSLTIPKIDADPFSSIKDIGMKLDFEGARLTLDELPWADFTYRPEVRVVVGHTGTAICVRFDVHERAVLAEKTESNSQVSEDSCVEMFIAPVQGGPYYNLEWNCIGTCLAGVGMRREGRELLGHRIISSIRRSSTLGTSPFGERLGEQFWSLTAVAPLSVFVHHDIATLGGLKMAANFYKCGDHLSVPHYVAWSSVGSPLPDFHRPDYFGLVTFER